MNVLFVTLDQFRGDCLSVAGHPLVKTPNLDRLAARGVRFARHYSQAAPCGPGRASLYTGMYQLNHRVVGNGTPLDDRFDNVGRLARRAGYRPALFGYADQAVDPRTVAPGDPALLTYQGPLPGFDVELDLPDGQDAWVRWLEQKGFGPFEGRHGREGADGGHRALSTENERPADVGVSAFVADALLEWIGRQNEPWFAHASFWRPHPPYVAAGSWSTAYDPACVPAPSAPPTRPAPRSGRLAAMEVAPAELPALAAQYFGAISAVDEQLGRVWDAIDWDDTLVIVTSDHGEQLGDQGVVGKGGPFESSYHVPAIVHDPRHPDQHGTVVTRYTEAVDILPTVAVALGAPIPRQCDGLPLTCFLEGEDPPWWRDAAHWEYDWRWEYLRAGPHEWPWDRRLERQHLAAVRTDEATYVQWGGGEWRCYRSGTVEEVDDVDVVLDHAQRMLTWRSQHADRTLTGTLLPTEAR